jgi:hypothetical protein
MRYDVFSDQVHVTTGPGRCFSCRVLADLCFNRRVAQSWFWKCPDCDHKWVARVADVELILNLRPDVRELVRRMVDSNVT